MASAPTFVPHRHAMHPEAAYALNRAIRAERSVAYWTGQIRTCRSAQDRRYVNGHIRAAKRECDEAFAEACMYDTGPVTP